jgi:[ribosomal protein S5]-alanine N-acetyltransferase
MRPFPADRIDTSRFVLRRPMASDAPEIYDAYARDEEVTRYIVWRPHRSLEETRSYVARVMEAWATATGHRSWVIERRADGRLLGMIGGVHDAYGVKVGYVLARAFWGNGVMTEALRAVCESALEDPRVFRVWAVCDVENAASARVMEKAGMQLEGTLRRYLIHPNRSHEPRDCLCYARVR